MSETQIKMTSAATAIIASASSTPPIPSPPTTMTRPNNTIEIVDDDKNTNLHVHAAAGKVDLVLKELETVKKIDIENYLGWTPLMMACRNSHVNVVNALLKHRADATKKNKFGYSVFLMSIASGNLELISIILQHLLCGGVSRQSMENIFSPISLAILYSQEKVVKYLLSKSFNIDAATPATGITPLMFASAMQHKTFTTYLLSKNADSTRKNYTGLQAKDMAIVKYSTNKIGQKLDSSPAVPKSISTDQPVKSQPPIQPPVISVHQSQPSPQVPFIYLNPHPYYQMSPNTVLTIPNQRRSSNVESPSYYMSPNVSPFTPITLVPQVFFPPEFSQTHSPAGMSPMLQHIFHAPEFLNYRLNHSNGFISPVLTPQAVQFPSQCV